MKKFSRFVKTLFTTLTAALMAATMALGACAEEITTVDDFTEESPAAVMTVSGPSVSAEDAALQVGDTWAFTYTGAIDWSTNLVRATGANGIVLVDGIIEYVGNETGADGTHTVTYKAVEPGSGTMKFYAGQLAIGTPIKTVTLTVTEAGSSSASEEVPSENDSSSESPSSVNPAAPAETDSAKSSESTSEASASSDSTAASSSESEAPVFLDTRSAADIERETAIANGTWGIEYTVCTACGTHNWTRKGSVYVCDGCGHETATVKGPAGVKGYVGSTGVAPVAEKAASATVSKYATAAAAQAAADSREAAYAAAVAALQKSIAAREAAYLSALKG